MSDGKTKQIDLAPYYLSLSPQRRLLAFIDKFYTSRSEFARLLDMSSQNLRHYTHETSILGANKKVRAAQLGLNIDWYLTGKGEMIVETIKDEPKATESNVSAVETTGYILVPSLDKMTIEQIRNLNNWYETNQTRIKQILQIVDATD